MPLPSRNISTYALPKTSPLSFLLAEDGSYLLCENNTAILLDEVAGVQTLPSRNASTSSLPVRN